MALGFVPSEAGLLLLQASMVAAPKAASQIKALRRFHSRGWALVPIASIVLVIFAIRYVSDTATGLTWLALITVPILAAIALAWAMRGATPLAALAVLPLFLVAWAGKGSLAAHASEAIQHGTEHGGDEQVAVAHDGAAEHRLLQLREARWRGGV
jgi:hypothetical protein